MSDSLTLGTVIFTAVKPVIKIYLIIGCGFVLARYNILTVETARNLSDMVLIIIGPCLTFNKIVTSISGSDIKTIGIIVLTSLVLFVTGALCGVLNLFFTPVSKKWIGGLFCAAILSNGGDLPIAYMQSMDTGLIFTTEQGDKGIAYIQIFAALSTFVQFNLGGYRLVEYDFRGQSFDVESTDSVEDDTEYTEKNENAVEDEDDDDNTKSSNALPNNDHDENVNNDDTQSVDTLSSISTADENGRNYDPIPFSNELRHKNSKNSMVSTKSKISRIRTSTSGHSHSNKPSSRRNSNSKSKSSRQRSRSNSFFNNHKNSLNLVDSRRMSHTLSLNSQFSNATNVSANGSVRNMELRTLPSQNMNDLILEYSHQPTIAKTASNALERKNTNLTYLTDVGPPPKSELGHNPTEKVSFVSRYHLDFLIFFLKNFKRPQSIAVVISVTCSMIPWVKALFVSTGSVVLPNAPDELPPLSFIMDFTSYIGAAQVPMGLLLLGSTLARLKIDKFPTGFWKTSIVLTCCKLCIMPIIGILWATLVRKKTWLGSNVELANIGFFIMILNYGLPSGTNQIYLTASYTDPNDLEHLQMDCLAIVLLNEYAFLVVSLPFLVTYTIKVFLHY